MNCRYDRSRARPIDDSERKNSVLRSPGGYSDRRGLPDGVRLTCQFPRLAEDRRHLRDTERDLHLRSGDGAFYLGTDTHHEAGA